jgi:DNA-binding MarR family transcriptional regulator
MSGKSTPSDSGGAGLFGGAGGRGASGARELALGVRQLGHRLSQAQDELGAELGLKPGWLEVITALARAGEDQRLSPSRLSREAMLSTAGMTNRLDRLEQAGLVQRLPDPDDRRGVLVELTDAGRELAEAAGDAESRASRRLFDKLDARERAELARITGKLIEAPMADEPPEPRASLFPTGRVAPRRRRR